MASIKERLRKNWRNIVGIGVIATGVGAGAYALGRRSPSQAEIQAALAERPPVAGTPAPEWTTRPEGISVLATQVTSLATEVAGGGRDQSPVTTAQEASIGEPKGLKYQFDEGCAETAEPEDYPACWLQRVQAGEATVEEAVVAIQQLGQRFGAPSFEGMTLNIPNRQPALVWCPDTAVYPPDTARPLEGTAGDQWKDNLVVINAGTGGPDRVVIATGSHPCWAVYVR